MMSWQTVNLLIMDGIMGAFLVLGFWGRKL